MTTNLECVVNVLAAHREARHWTDEAAAADVVAQLGLDPAGEAKNAAPVVSPGITEDEVLAHEAAAKEAVDKATAARAALEAQKDPDAAAKAQADADAAAEQARADEAAAAENTSTSGRSSRVRGSASS